VFLRNGFLEKSFRPVDRRSRLKDFSLWSLPLSGRSLEPRLDPLLSSVFFVNDREGLEDLRSVLSSEVLLGGRSSDVRLEKPSEEREEPLAVRSSDERLEKLPEERDGLSSGDLLETPPEALLSGRPSDGLLEKPLPDLDELRSDLSPEEDLPKEPDPLEERPDVPGREGRSSRREGRSGERESPERYPDPWPDRGLRSRGASSESSERRVVRTDPLLFPFGRNPGLVERSALPDPDFLIGLPPRLILRINFELRLQGSKAGPKYPDLST
ncbi:MAG: hypothetical protein ACKOQ6_10875, partial [Bacteroidota bacterium]